MRDLQRHSAQWRDPAQIASQWQSAGETDPRLLHHRVRGRWWETLAEQRITLIVTRETEHLIVAMRADEGGPQVSYIRLPHPSGLVVDRHRNVVHIASTRNPNQIFDFEPGTVEAGGLGLRRGRFERPVLVPVRSRLLPGSLYIHDLALVGRELHANAVGQNAVVRIDEDAGYERVWWPRCIETPDGPVFWRNQLQLNSIAAGENLETSYFSASTDELSSRRPGHLNFRVDHRGVIFAGSSREPVVRGLTRPHSARMHQGRIWVANSGYGTFGPCEDGILTVAAALSGWTRGLCFSGSVAFVGTSHVLPRFRAYAPGLNVAANTCGVHAFDVATGQLLGSLVWPSGNQVFGIDWIDTEAATGFPFKSGRRARRQERALFYSFATTRNGGSPRRSDAVGATRE